MLIQPWRSGTVCPYEFWAEFKKNLDNASYHYADDSGKEWGHADLCLDAAAKVVVDNKLPFWVITRMLDEAKSLVTLSSLMQHVLNLLYQ